MTLKQTQLVRLRLIDIRPYVQDGRPFLLLRDPLQLTGQAVTIPQQWAPLLMLCDGTRDIKALSAALAVRHGMRVGPDVMAQLVDALDEALLLDNERFAEAREQALNNYRQAAFRLSSSAGQAYPADANELDRLLNRYLDTMDKQGDEEIDAGDVRGLVSPHIDYMRGGPVYARVWKRAEKAVKAADLVVLLGTDHQGIDNALTLTRQHYATPFGILPTARDVVDKLADALGHQAAFAGELYHRSEHSIDLAAVWLHFMRGKSECEIVPILCGSFGNFVEGDEHPASDPALNSVIDALRQAIDGRKALIVAAADLSHVGSAFGGQPLDLVTRAQMQAADCKLIEQMCAGDAEGFFTAIKDDRDRYNVCGLSPIYLTMRALAPVRGEQIIYEHCPADQNGTSLVSICGTLFA